MSKHLFEPGRFGSRSGRAKLKGEIMKILKRYVEEDVWNETTQEECLEHTEGSGYWVEGSVLPLLAEGHVVHTPFAHYKVATDQLCPMRNADHDEAKQTAHWIGGVG